MTPCPALLSIPLYDYFLIQIWLATSHVPTRPPRARKVIVTNPRVTWARKVL